MNHIQYDEEKIVMKLHKEKKPSSIVQPPINASSKRNISIKKHGFDDFYESFSEDNHNRKKKKGGADKSKYYPIYLYLSIL